MMREGSPALVRREAYTAPAFWIKSVDLCFDLDPAKTMVINRMVIERNTDEPAQALRLHGEDLNLTRLLVNGESASFRQENGLLVIDSLEHIAPVIRRLEQRHQHQPDGDGDEDPADQRVGPWLACVQSLG